MDSTLSVLDDAFNSGKRSRTSSFATLRETGDLLGLDLGAPDAGSSLSHEELSPGHPPDPRFMSATSASLSSAIGRSPSISTAFLTHRRQASDASAADPDFLSATTSPFPPHTSTCAPDHRPPDVSQRVVSPVPAVDPLGSPVDPSAFNVFDDEGLEDAFNSNPFMHEQHSYSAAQTQNEHFSNSDNLQQQPYLGSMDQAYHDMLRKSVMQQQQQQMQMQQRHSQMAFAAQGNIDLGEQTYNMGLARHNPPADRRASFNHGLQFDGARMYEDSGALALPDSAMASTNDGSLHSPMTSLHPDATVYQLTNSQPHLLGSHSSMSSPYNQSPISTAHGEANLRRFSQHSQTPPQLRLEVPTPDNFSLQTSSLEVPSPYSDTASFDGSAYGDHASPSVDPLALSRTTSFNSQYQPHYDQHHYSSPASPFMPQNPYASHVPQHQTSMHQQQAPLDSYNVTLDQDTFTQEQQSQYNFLQPRIDPHGQGLYRDAQGLNPITIPHPTNSFHSSFDAPDISINPPTPSGHSYLNRHAVPSYPFPQVPVITTTNAPSVDGGHEYDHSSGLSVDRTRGRSHSESGLHPHGHRSRSPSPHNSDSSGRTGSHSSTLRLDPRSSSHSRVSKPSKSNSRRASWSGAQESIDQDLLSGGREGQQSSIKQKNPATFICPVEGCNKAFTRAYNLRSHQRTHTNERPFLCEVCKKGFARQHDRKRHEKLHTNEKPFSCPGCMKKFARMDALSRHFKSETGKDCIIGHEDYEHFLLEGLNGHEQDGEEDDDGGGEEDDEKGIVEALEQDRHGG